jgi:hypothetical protein
MVESIERIGGIHRKSLVIEFPQIPEPFLFDFIRGFYDGDGTIGIKLYEGARGNTYNLRCGFCGGLPFISKLKEILEFQIPWINQAKLSISKQKNKKNIDFCSFVVWSFQRQQLWIKFMNE